MDTVVRVWRRGASCLIPNVFYDAHVGEIRNIYKILVGKLERKRPPGRPRCKWEDGLEWILGKFGGKVWRACIWPRTGTSAGLL
jgi:hypothetical protein